MTRRSIAVFGDLNLDTRVSIHGFPVDRGDTWFTFDGISDVVGGAAANVAHGLTALGTTVRLGSVIGTDDIGDLILARLVAQQLDVSFLRRDWPLSSRTVVLVDGSGHRRCINDPKGVHDYRFPEDEVSRVIGDCSWVFTSTQAWCRSVARQAKAMGRKVAVDVQALVDVDEYHREFLACADLVLLSTECLAVHSHDLMRRLWSELDVETVVATHGAGGATLGVRSSHTIDYEPAHDLRPVRDLTGAGDALAAGVLDAVLRGCSWRDALTFGQLTAAWKIGCSGSTQGFPPPAKLTALFNGSQGQGAGAPCDQGTTLRHDAEAPHRGRE